MPAEAPRSPSDSTVPGADALPTLLRKLVLLGIAVGAMFALACGGGNPDVGQLKTGPRGAGAIPESEATEGTVVDAVPNRTPIAPATAAPAPTAAPYSRRLLTRRHRRRKPVLASPNPPLNCPLQVTWNHRPSPVLPLNRRLTWQGCARRSTYLAKSSLCSRRAMKTIVRSSYPQRRSEQACGFSSRGRCR